MQDFKIVPVIISPERFPVRVASCDDNKQIWIDGAYYETLELRTWGLPSGGGAVSCQINFENREPMPLQSSRILDVNRITTLHVDLPSENCDRSCRASVTCGVGTKSFTFSVIYFSYARPLIGSMFPSEGPKAGGTVVKMRIKDFIGPWTKYGAGCPDNFVSAYLGTSSYSVKAACHSQESDVTSSLVLSTGGDFTESDGEIVFDLILQMPSSPCPGEGLANLTINFGPKLVDWVMPNSAGPIFQYVGAQVCTVTPPSAVISLGTGGASLTAILCNIRPDECVNVKAILEISDTLYRNCNVTNSIYDVEQQTLTLRLNTPEVEQSLARMLKLRFEGCSRALYFEFEALRLPDPVCDMESILVDDLVQTCLSNQKSDSVLTFTIRDLAIWKYDSFQAIGIHATRLIHRQEGANMAFEITIDGTQMPPGQHILQIKGMRDPATQALLPCEIMLCVRDESVPYLITMSPSCGPHRGGTIVLMGINGANSFSENICLDRFEAYYSTGQVNYVSSNGSLVGVVPISEWGSNSQRYRDVMRKTSGLSFSNEALTAEYETVVLKTQDMASSTAIIVVLRMPSVLGSGDVMINVKNCAGSEEVRSIFTMKDPDPVEEVGAYPFSEGQIAVGSVHGGGLLAVKLTNFPVVYEKSEMIARFGSTPAEVTKLLVSDCNRTLIYIRIPAGDVGQVVVHVSFDNFMGTFDFLYVDDLLPYIRSYAPSSVYVDDVEEIVAEVVDLPKGCVNIQRDIQISIQSINGMQGILKRWEIIEQHEEYFKMSFVFQATGLPGKASVSLSFCGKTARTFYLEYLKMPAANPIMSLSRSSGYCRGEGRLSVTLTEFKKTDASKIRVQFGSKLLLIDESPTM